MKLSVKMVSLSLIGLCLVGILFFLFYQKKAEKKGAYFEVAEVGSQVVTLEEFLNLYKEMRNEHSSASLGDPKTNSKLKNLTLETLVYEKLTKAFIKNQYPRLSSFLDSQSLLDKFLREQIRPHIEITDKMAQEYFIKKHSDQLVPEKFHLKHILVKDRKLAQNIQAILKSQPHLFEKQASKNSIAPEAEKGGDLGLLTRYEALPEFSPVFDLKVGEFTDIIESTYGFHIIKLVDKNPSSSLRFEDLKKQILDELRAQEEKKIFSEKLTLFSKTIAISKNTSILDSLP
ncbi:MAG: peptidylprolyl isomerase [Deltaproteobacteria bacterium]|nr:peptidylprolyl isomerase [Deltaproteobacteria bacterium]